MASIPPVSRVVIGGVDTHKDLHVAAVIDTDDHVLDTKAYYDRKRSERKGHKQALLAFARRRINVLGP